MATGIILAGGTSRRMPGDKAFMEVSGRPVISIQLEVVRGLFEEILIVCNRERIDGLSVFEGPGVRVVEEPVRGRGPLGGILSGLEVSGADENFVLACDMPFIRKGAVAYVMERLAGYQVAVPRTPGGLEPLHAAYNRSCMEVMRRQLDAGDMKVTDFYGNVSVNYIPWDELRRFDPGGRLLFNINSPGDMKKAAGVAGDADNNG